MTTKTDETHDCDVSAAATAQDEEREPARRAILRLIRPAIVMTLALTIITGLIYPGIITGLAQVFFPSQANGSILYVNGKPIASSLIGQYWTQAQLLPWPSLCDQQPAGNACALLRRQLRRLQPGPDEPDAHHDRPAAHRRPEEGES